MAFAENTRFVALTMRENARTSVATKCNDFVQRFLEHLITRVKKEKTNHCQKSQYWFLYLHSKNNKSE
jgi:hypothetical protein